MITHGEWFGKKEIDEETETYDYEGNTGVFDEPYPWRPNEIIGILKHIIEVADTNSCGVKEIDGIDEEAINNAITIIGSFEQIKWERDTAIAQLKELGYEFGEKIETIDDKPVTGIRKYRKEARRWKRKYIRVNNQLSKCKKLLENDDIQSHTDEM